MPKQYLDASVLSRIANLELIARSVVEGLVTGLHRSPYKGFNIEFAVHRPYMPGDEIRHLDWKVYARRERFYIKQYEEETNLRGYLVLDASASMNYGTGDNNKWEYSCRLAASLAYLMLQQRDSVGMATFNQALSTYIPARSNTEHLHAILEELAKITPQQKTDIYTALEEMAQNIQRRGLIILVSDLLYSPDRVLEALKHLRYRHNEVIVFHIFHNDELNLPLQGFFRFTDMESEKQIIADPGIIRRGYKKHIQELITYYKRGCEENHIDYVVVPTNEPLSETLFSYLASRQARTSWDYIL